MSIKRPYVKIVIWVSAVVLMYGLLLVADVLIKPPITEDEMARALSYAESHALPLPPRAFFHDGCTAFPDTLLWHDFYEACFAHDIAYWLGGTENEREKANALFKEQIAATGLLGPLFAFPMYTAVALFGNNWTIKLLDANWGYGWNK